MSPARSRGFSLIELIVALSLASLVFVAITSLFTPMIRTQVQASNGLRSQGEALLSLKSLNRDIARASEIYLPAASWAGDTLSGSCTWDNSADNPNQLSSPPKAVTWGEGTDDEMCVFLTYVSLAL